MKTLYLLRHAKSSWTEPELADRDRPLAFRGLRATATLAEHLTRVRIRPDRVICSPARRAVETLEGIRRVLPTARVEVDEALYPGEPEALIGLLRNLPGECRSVLLVGHNPALEDLAGSLLTAEGHDPSVKRMRQKYPTGALATLEAPAEWGWLRPGSCTLQAFVRPRDL